MITEQHTPNIHFRRTTNVLVNFIGLLWSPNSTIMPVNAPIHMKSRWPCAHLKGARPLPPPIN
jgi:hypothetical protein